MRKCCRFVRASKSVCHWLKSLIAALVGLVLSLVMIWGVSSFVSLLSDDFNDFDFSDLYMRVCERRSVASLSNDVVIVSVDGCSRKGIQQMIEAVDCFSPAAVGLDMFFLHPSEDGDALVRSITSCNNMVLPFSLDREACRSYFYDSIDAEYGVVNLLSYSAFDVVRDYVTSYQTDSIEYLSMPLALIRKAGLSDVEPDINSKHIWFSSVDFDIITSDEIIDEDGLPNLACAERIEGKIVLIGDIGDLGDIHRTPIDDVMPGIMVQAHIIDTIINDRHVKEVSMFGNLLLAFVVSLLFVRLHVHLKDTWDDVGEMFMRLIQFVLLYMFFVLGVNLYLNHNIFIDFSVTLTMLCISMLALSIVNGSIYIWQKIRRK